MTIEIPQLFERRDRPVFSFEFFLPKAPDDVSAFLRTAAELKSLEPGFVTLTYGAGGSGREKTIETAGLLQKEVGIPTACHLTCITHTREEIAAILDRLEALEIRSVVALRGDQPKDAAVPPPDKRDFGYARDLVAFIKRRGGFRLAVAGYPETHPEAPSPEFDLGNLKAKVDAGGDWVITQLFFDNADYFRFVERARAAGVSAPIVPGLMPVTGYQQLKRFSQVCGAGIPAELMHRLDAVQHDPEAVVACGIEWATRQCRGLLAGGAPGVHFYTLNRSRSTAEILRRLRKG